jgi:hypothetical protein
VKFKPIPCIGTRILNLQKQELIYTHYAALSFKSSEGDLVFDPFAGSNTTGYVAEKLSRNWCSCELSQEYLDGSKFRFFDDVLSKGLKLDNQLREDNVSMFDFDMAV